MANKLYDCAVVTGEYTTAQGEQKKRYLNVGAVIEGDHGPYLLLERTFNPAGVPGQEGRSSVIISLFKPKDRDAQPVTNPAPAQQTNDFDGIPF